MKQRKIHFSGSQAKGLPLNAGEAWCATLSVRRSFAFSAARSVLGLVDQAQQSVTAKIGGYLAAQLSFLRKIYMLVESCLFRRLNHAANSYK